MTGGTAKRKSIGTTGYHKKIAYGREDVDGEMMGKKGSLPWALAGQTGLPRWSDRKRDGPRDGWSSLAGTSQNAATLHIKNDIEVTVRDLDRETRPLTCSGYEARRLPAESTMATGKRGDGHKVSLAGSECSAEAVMEMERSTRIEFEAAKGTRWR